MSGFKEMCVLRRFSCVRLFATPWTVDPQASLSKGFSRQEHWKGKTDRTWMIERKVTG